MMKRLDKNPNANEQAVTNMLEYIFISGVLLLLMVITVLTLTTGVIEPPTNHLTEYAFIDIGNGISTRIVDFYAIVPFDQSTGRIIYSGDVTTLFDIPDEVIGKGYYVTLRSGDEVSVYRDQIRRNISLVGIGITKGVGGTTTGEGLNKISYRSGGF